MTDEELVYALRNNVGVSDYSRVAANLAADRIEQLLAERNTWQKEALQQNGLMHNALLGAAKAKDKLAKAYNVISCLVVSAPEENKDDEEWTIIINTAKNFLDELETEE